MPVGPVSNLPALPSPTAGIGGAGVMPGLVEGLGQIEQAVKQKKERAKQEAQQQIPTLVQMAKAQPNNQAVQQALARALQTAGLPVPYQPTQNAPQTPNSGAISPQAAAPPQAPPAPQATPQTAPPPGMVQVQPPNLTAQAPLPQIQQAAQPQHGAAEWLARMAGQKPAQQQPAPQQQVDVSALMPQTPPTDKELEYIQSLPPGKQREAVAASWNKQIDPFILNEAPQMLVPGSPGWVAINKNYEQEQSKIAAGQETAQGYNKWLNAEKSNLQAAGIDTSSLAQDPDTVQQLGAKTQAQIQELEAHGVHFKEADKIALMRAKTVDELVKAQTTLVSVKAKALPLEDAHKWAYQEKMGNAALTRATAYASNVSRLAQMGSRGGNVSGQMLRLASLYDSDNKSLDNQIDREQDFLTNQITSNGLDPNLPMQSVL